jgi:hypothetical protein
VYYQVDISSAPAGSAHTANDLTEQLRRVGATVLRIGIGKNFANISKRSGTEQSVGNCVQDGICVRMTHQSVRVRDSHAP